MKTIVKVVITTATVGLSAPVSADTTYRFHLIDNLVFVPVLVNGKAGNGALDTGTDTIVVDQQFARRVGVSKGRAVGNAGGSGTHPVTTWQATVRLLTAPGLHLRNTAGRIMDTIAYTKSAGAAVDVIIGPQYFRHRIVSIDYPHQTLTIASGPAARVHCSHPIAFKLIENAPVIQAVANFDAGRTKHPLRLMVDIGTRHQAMFLDDRFLRTPEGQRLRHRGRQVQLSVGVGGPVYGWSSIAPSLVVGSRIYRDVPFAASAQLGRSPYDGFLGVPFWKNGTIELDYDRGRLCLST